MTMIGRSHRSHAIAQTHVGMTWLLGPTTPRYAMSGFHNKKDDNDRQQP